MCLSETDMVVLYEMVQRMIYKNKKEGKVHIVSKADIILIAVILIVAGIFFILHILETGTGLEVYIYIDGRTEKVLSLDKDTVYEADTSMGYNRIVIDEGEVYVELADCPDGICVNHKPVNQAGDTIICLPHKLVVEVK